MMAELTGSEILAKSLKNEGTQDFRACQFRHFVSP